VSTKSKPDARPQFRYVGPLAEALVVLPSGRSLRVARGEAVELLPSEVDAVESSPNWARVAPDSTQEKTP
jgi:hypothetical protein